MFVVDVLRDLCILFIIILSLEDGEDPILTTAVVVVVVVASCSRLTSKSDTLYLSRYGWSNLRPQVQNLNSLLLLLLFFHLPGSQSTN
jgi:hypothetical protein